MKAILCILFLSLFIVGCDAIALKDPGCMNPEAINFRLSATKDDGSCLCDPEVLRVVDSPFATAREELNVFLGSREDVFETHTYESKFIRSIDYSQATQIEIIAYMTNTFDISRYDGIYDVSNSANITIYIVEDSQVRVFLYDSSLEEYVEQAPIAYSSPDEFYALTRIPFESC